MRSKAAFSRRLRQFVQVVFFCAFIVLAAYASAALGSVLSWELPLRLDPLVSITTMMAQRRWIPGLLPAGILLAATVVLGRFWCGWLCPVGTLLDWLSPRKLPRTDHPSPWHGAKYAVLFTIFFAALWGNLTLLVLDPLTIWMRWLAAFVFPALTWLVTQAQRVLYKIAFLREALHAADDALRGSWLSFRQPYFAVSALSLGLLLAIIALTLVKRRAWCRYLCPLGGLLSLTAKASLLKRTVADTCTSCGACAKVCTMGAIDPKKAFSSDSGECVLCLDCTTACPVNAIHFHKELRYDRGWEYDPSRRQVLGALGASLGGLALVKIGTNPATPHIRRLRPPMVVEDHLLSACVRCGACFRICPTQGLQPSLAEAGLEGFGTPILVPRQGNCEYTCTACGNICPTGAIPHFTAASKYNVPIGKAYIDPVLCIPWSGRGDCIVCEEMCPVPQKAIILTERQSQDATGGEITLLAPVVLHERCIGCGLCERKCPVKGEAAIRVRVDPMT